MSGLGLTSVGMVDGLPVADSHRGKTGTDGPEVIGPKEVEDKTTRADQGGYS